MKQLIRQAAIVFPDRVVQDWELLLEDGQIAAIAEKIPLPSDCEVHSFAEDIIIPGLIDTHVHGAGGCDAMDGTPESLAALRRTLLKEGTTAFLATTISSPPDQLRTALSNLKKAKKIATAEKQAELLGVHLEGPFLSRQYKGSHIADFIPQVFPGDDLAAITSLLKDFPGLIRLIDLGVERPDTKELARLCRGQNILLAAGHTGADYETMKKAAALGICRLTHAFNAMPGIHHRQPGPLTEGLLNPAIELELIADGVHIHPAILELALRLKPNEKITLISDGTRAVGMPNGEYELGGQTTIVNNGIARLADGTIAGSAYPLLQGLRTIVQKLGRPLQEAVRFASLNPAQTFGVSDRLGSLETGKEATFLRVNKELALKEVWLRGERVL